MIKLAALITAAILLLVAPASVEAAGPESVAKLAAALSPAVVNISTSHKVGGSGVPFPTAPEGSPLSQLLENVNPNSGDGPDAMEQALSLGSGFIIKPEGVIVTNNHVIEGADQVYVFLTDGTRLAAKVVGHDDKADLAVLKVDAGRPLPFVEFGNSDSAEVGDWVMAIGNPFGLGGSVSLGIVSARNRDINSGPYDDFIQTDAAINQGNSGGPLFDMNGKVVGINTAIIARGGSALGIGFAVPVNLAQPVVEQLAEYGETRRGWLGVGIEDVSDTVAQSLGLPNTNGAMVIDITKTGPADGVLEEGDIILKFGDRPIAKLKDLPRAVAETTVGKVVPLTVLRGGKSMVVDVTLGRLEVGEQVIAEQTAPASTPGEDPDLPVGPAPGLPALLGLDVAPLDQQNRKSFGIGPAATGVVISDVTAGSDAARQGLSKGQVISEVNQQKVATVADVTEKVNAAKEAGRPAVLFKISDPTGGNRFVAVKLIN